MNLNTTTIANYTKATTFDDKGMITSQSIAYFDDLGRATQTQSRILSKNRVVVTQTLYDEFGRAKYASLAAPVAKNNFNYIDKLLPLNAQGQVSNADKTASPLFKYYNKDNTEEEYTDITDYPYAETEYSETQPNTARKTYGAGEAFRKGTGHEVQTYSIMALPQEITKSPAASFMCIKTLKASGENYESDYIGATKTISIDAEGKEAISYINDGGKVIATCRSGVSEISQTYLVQHTLKQAGEVYFDIHLPAGIGSYNVEIDGTWHYEVVDLTTDEVVQAGNNDVITLGPGVYRIVALCDNVDPVTIKYNMAYQDYAFTAYDDAGRAIRTISPQDVKDMKTYRDALHTVEEIQTELGTRVSSTTYNSLGWVLSSYSKDLGKSTFFYTRDGKIRYSQNALQAEVYKEEALRNPKFSYTNYDDIGRPVESGVIDAKAAHIYYMGESNIPQYNVSSEDYLEKTYEPGEYGLMGLSEQFNSSYSDQSFTLYDVPAADLNLAGYVQQFMIGKVSRTMNANATTWYSYDYQGRVTWVVQKMNGFDLNADGQVNTGDFVTLDYEYDFFGKVLTVTYNKDKTSQFKHRYEYNIDGSLVAVYTRAGTNDEVLQAKYSYYTMGGLKRTEIAGNLQGIDYVYNLQGWLKAINNPDTDNDPGKDGKTGSAHANFKADAFSFALDYFNGDYLRSGKGISSTAPYNRYDGMITGARHFTKGQQLSVGRNGEIGTQNAWRYIYDDRNNLQNANTGFYDLTQGYLINGRYNEGDLSYDANGNILSLTRSNEVDIHGGYLTNTFDQLTYHYIPGTNRLNYIEDNASIHTAVTNELITQGTDNYTYDVLGQLTDNVADGQYFIYNAAGLVTDVFKTKTDRDARNYSNDYAKYTYNEAGYRIKKEVKEGTNVIITWYVRDASGTIFSTYDQPGTSELPEAKELTIYGSGRLGIAQLAGGNIDKYVYELADHLGNVRATITKNNTTGDADVLSYNDYYPFGWEMPGRSYTAEAYRFGYQGKFAEKDPETGLTQFEARLWDGRSGRWLSYDPAGQYWSPYVGMGNNPVGSVDPDGRQDWGMTDEGFIVKLKTGENDPIDKLYKVKGKDNIIDGEKGMVEIKDKNLLPELAKVINRKKEEVAVNQGKTFSIAISGNSWDIAQIYDFAINNTKVEWAVVGFNDGNQEKYLIGTNHDDDLALPFEGIVLEKAPFEQHFLNIHSHIACRPDEDVIYHYQNRYPSPQDNDFVNNAPQAKYYLYEAGNKVITKFNQYSPRNGYTSKPAGGKAGIHKLLVNP